VKYAVSRLQGIWGMQGTELEIVFFLSCLLLGNEVWMMTGEGIY